MAHQRQRIRTAIILLIVYVCSTNAAKNSARPVHEIINEQARMDEKRIQTNPSLLPYGNPLAGNSNAKLHAQNQQAMFNAERVRQHRAQLQRLNKSPQQTDSYMRAYHESQENHQLALEQQQSNLKDKKPVTKTPVARNTATRSSVTRAPQRQRQSVKRTRGPDLTKIMQEDAVQTDKTRNHRSYGSVEYHQHLHPKQYKTVYVSAGPTYDQGVTIKPNGNVGLTSLDSKEEDNQLYTQAVASNIQYVYPKQFHQMQQYESAQDIASLNALLHKEPQDQLLELNALIQPDNQKELETPIDLFFYNKEPLSQTYGNSIYGQIPSNYASAYTQSLKDHTPITEEIDDVEDPNNVPKAPFTVRPITSTTKEITTNNINYYSVAPTIATSSEYYQKEDEKPAYQALVYEKPLTIEHQTMQGEASEKYIHGKHIGVQHLNEDGTGVSAYSDDNLHYAANYEFGYHVRDHHSGNDFGHHEAKKDGKTDGHYHVLLPDGRMQNVKYHAGPSGFHADISYELQ